MRKLLLVLTIVGLSTANAKSGPKSYNVNIPDQCIIGTTHVKPGEYRLKIDGSLAVFSDDHAREIARVPVTVSTMAKKFERSEFYFSGTPDTSEKLTAIELNGTKLTLQFKD